MDMMLKLKSKNARYTIIWFMYGEVSAKTDMLVTNLKEHGFKSEWLK